MTTLQDDDNYNKRELKPVPLLSGIEEIRQDFEERLEGGDTVYGIEILDDYVKTIRPGSLTFILARPNSGKSLLSQHLASNLAKQDKRVLLCSCEMGSGLLMERQLKILAGIDVNDLMQMYRCERDGANRVLDMPLDNFEYAYLNNIDVVETGGATVIDLMKMLDIYNEYDMVIVDYIQRVKGKGTEYENISNACRELQTYARRTGKPLIVCSQAKRPASGSTPNLADAGSAGKGSGSIEEDGDVAILLSELFEGSTKYILMTLFKNRYGNKNITYKYKLNHRLQFLLEQKDI